MSRFVGKTLRFVAQPQLEEVLVEIAAVDIRIAAIVHVFCPDIDGIRQGIGQADSRPHQVLFELDLLVVQIGV